MGGDDKPRVKDTRTEKGFMGLQSEKGRERETQGLEGHLELKATRQLVT